MIGFSIESYGQGLEVTITTDKNFYERSDTIYIKYWIENTNDKPIVFLDKGGLTISKHCFGIYGANEELRRKDYGNIKREDFITIEPNEPIVRTFPYIVYWMCRSAPPFEDWALDISYRVERDESENFYYKLNDEEKKEKVFMDAWTGAIESNIDDIIILGKDY
jgi:hypothetical protein